MEQRFAVAVHIRGELCHVLQVALGGDRLLQIVGGVTLHTVLIGGVCHNPLFLGCGHWTRINAERHAVFFSKIAQYSLFRGACRVLTQRPDATKSVPANKIVREEFYHGRSDHIQKSFLRLGREISVNSAYFLLHDNPPIVCSSF